MRTAILAMAEFIAFSAGVFGRTNDKLVGTWKLVSASSTSSTGEQSETPYGASPVGFLTYTGDGRVTALISYGGRKPLSVGGGTLAPLEEQAEAFKTFLAYAGRYTLSGDKVTHYIEISSIQNYVNRDLVRSVKFQGDRIILVTPPTPVNGKIQTVELIWQRLSGGS
jgi:lipocalin-like protein